MAQSLFDRYRQQQFWSTLQNAGDSLLAMAGARIAPSPPGPSLLEFAKLDELQRSQRQEANQQSARSTLLGGLDPRSGITWNQPRQGMPESEKLGLLGQAYPEATGKALLARALPKPPEVPSGFESTPTGLRPIPGGPADIGYLAQKAEETRAPAEAPSAYREWLLAREGGFGGSFADWKKLNRSEQNVIVGGGKYGQIPSGYMLQEGPEGARLVPIPGGPPATEAAKEEEAEARRVGVETETKASKAATMLDATRGIKEEIKDATLPTVGTASRPFGWYSGTAAGRVRSHVNTLKSGIVLGAMIRLKDASRTGATGFGQMNRAELQTLIDDLGALDPDNTEEDIFLKTIDRIEDRYKRVVQDIRKNVSPERIQELGLEPLLERAESGGGWSIQKVE